jgi:hypothetical protein
VLPTVPVLPREVLLPASKADPHLAAMLAERAAKKTEVLGVLKKAEPSDLGAAR